MSEVDFDKLMKLASSPEVGQNADSLQGMLKEAEEVLKFAEKVISVVDRAGALPGMVRALGKKYDVDVETPLHSANGIVPNSDYHKEVLEQLNSIPADELKKQFEAAAKYMKDAGKSDTRKPGN